MDISTAIGRMVKKLYIPILLDNTSRSVIDFVVIPSLVITSILTTSIIKILITDIDNKCLLHPSASGFGGLVLACGTQDHVFAPDRNRRIFRTKKPQRAFLRRGRNAVCPMSQICGMLKNSAIYLEVGIVGQIDRPFLAQFRPSLTEVSHVAWRGAPLEMTGETKGGAQRARILRA
jgi:hypothetical protein